MSTKASQKPKPMSASAGWQNWSSGCSPGGAATFAWGTGGGLPSSVSGTAAYLADAAPLAARPELSRDTPAPAVSTHRISAAMANVAPFAPPFPGRADHRCRDYGLNPDAGCQPPG